MSVLNLVPSTRALANKLKLPLSAAVQATGATSMTLALRDNGPKVNGTLVAIVGKVGEVGDAFAARNGKNKAPFGPHVVLATADVRVTDEGVQLIDSDGMLDFDLEMKVPVFVSVAEAEAAVEAPSTEVVEPAAEAVEA